MLTKNDFCDYETCVALIELGYPEREILSYDFNLLLYEAQKWLREEKGIGITIFHNYYCDTREMYYEVELYNTKHHLKTFGEFSDWTQALAEGIKEAVKILREE